MSLIDQIQICIDNCALDISKVNDAIVFQSAGRSATIPIWGATPRTPSPAVYVHQALIVIETYNNCDDFLDWCAEYGWSPADLSRLELFKMIGSGCADLEAMIGADQLEILIRGLSLHQATEIAGSSSEPKTLS